MEERIEQFLIYALSQFIIPITITFDEYNYENVLKEVSRRLVILIRRLMCLFHIEEDIAHKIRMEHMDKGFDFQKKLIKY